MDHLLTEARNPASLELDRLSPLEFVHLMNEEDGKVIPAVRSQAEAIARGIEVIADRFQRGGQLVYVGAGTSGRLGVLDASECPPTFNSPPGQVIGIIAGGPKALTTAVEGAEDHPEFAEADLMAIQLNSNDILVGIASSGRTPYVLGALRYAKQVGAYAIGFTCVPDSELAPLSNLVIAPLVGPEIVTGSTRLKAGTATKLVLNMLTTGAMVRIGKTYGNLMIDLRATNVKLKARTNRIVRQFTGVNAEAAEQVLERCGGELKTAIVAQQLDIDAVAARQHLANVGGSIRAAIAPFEPMASATDLILGIDGGGSHTTALLAHMNGSSFDIIGKGKGGPSNLRAAGETVALRSLDDAISNAFRSAQVNRGKVASIVFGLAGAGREVEQTLIKNWANSRGIADSIEVVSDSSLLLAMLPEQWGIAVIAGTGSAVWGRSADGRTARAGGWGPLVGDEGSGYQIALAALNAVLRSHDGRSQPTALTPLMLRAMAISSPEAIIPAIHGKDCDRPRIAELASVVFEAAEQSDETAIGIIKTSARELALQIVAVKTRLDLPEHTPLAISGGLLLGQPGYQNDLSRNLESLGYRPRLTLPIAEPAEGALRLARAIGIG